MNETKIIYEAIGKYGMEHQCIVAMEECSELIKEISKFLRSKGSKENLIEEIVDVEIMIKQIKAIFSIKPEEIDKEKDNKMKRLEERLEEI